MEGENGLYSEGEASHIAQHLSALSLNDAAQDSQSGTDEKDPRKIARKYQMDLCKIAVEENTIVYLETGCGKTHIAVLLMYEMRQLIKKPRRKICVFLAPTVALVQQQAEVIRDSTDFQVGTYCGSSRHLRSHKDWDKEVEQSEVFVMTPQIFLHNLCHCFMKIESIALLIFDECHHAQLESNHPYAEIMKVFYNSNIEELPRIFGMTASPKLGKGGSISTLETLLHAKVHSVNDREELEMFVSSPVVGIHYYGPASDSSSCSLAHYCRKLDEIKFQCVSELSKEYKDHGALQSIKKTLLKLHNNLIFCLKHLGIRGAQQACRILLKGDQAERDKLIGAEQNGGDDCSTKRYLAQVAAILVCDSTKGNDEADLPCEEVLEEPYFSLKLLRLFEILLEFRVQPNMKCIVFVNRILVARSLSGILQSLKFLSSWKSHHLLGVHSGLKSASRKNMYSILEKFRSGELNLLVATKVAEEGLDIQTCCLVIRFDLPETVASFIQSRGRARMPKSEYAFLVDRGNESELNLIENFKKEEEKMNKEVTSTRPGITFVDFDEKTYKVSSTGATISCGASIQLVHHYCSKLPHDEYFIPKPEYSYFDDVNGTVCQILLPSNAPIRKITSTPQPSAEAARKDACLKACKKLHELGTLTDYLLPDQEDATSLEDLSDSDSSDDEDSRRELHEMLVPSALKEQWTDLDNAVCFYSYFFKFTPTPADRVYRKFGLFIKASLPSEAEKMKLDLSLACGRSVAVELIPSGVAELDKDEIRQALSFQEIVLKVILDRSDFIPEFFSLGKNGFDDGGSPTFYLLLPVIFHEPEPTVNVDWKLVRRFLSSPIFSTQEGRYHTAPPLDSLKLANGFHSIVDIRNSLVYAPCKGIFFFISDVVSDKNGYSVYKDSRNHVQHYSKKFGINLEYPNQPLLKAKQLFCLNNLLRKGGNPESREKEEHFVELPPEICQLKIIGFSKDIGSSLSLLPSVMHRLQSLLVAIQLKDRFTASFPEGAEITAYRVLEALTTEKCGEWFSLERLEVLGDAFLKFVVGRHVFLMHNNSDEGQLTRRRSNTVNNSNLLKLAIAKKLQVYIRDQPFEPCQYFALGRPCTLICSKETETRIHSFQENSTADGSAGVRCNKGHHWLHKKTIADVVEALVGAFIVDSGFKAATAFLKWIGIPLDFQPLQVSEICYASEVFKPLATEMDLSAIENALGYRFLHKGLLVQAFIHPSYNNHSGGCYQRLEFLGDAVLDYLITAYLYSVYPKLKPGQFTDLRSICVNNTSFANIAVLCSFHNHILCDSKELRTSMNKYVNFTRTTVPGNGPVEGPSCPKALGDLVESSVGAILLDSGFDLNRVWRIMLSFMDPVKNISNFRLHPGRELQELCQLHNMELQFPTLKKDGVYSVEAVVEGGTLREKAYATNINKKAARRMASERLFHKLKALGYKSKAKSLEEVLKSSYKMEAKLMGYDEAPIDITAPVSVLIENLNIQDPSGSRYNGELNHISEEPKKLLLSIRSSKQPHQPPEAQTLQSKAVIEDHRNGPVAPVTGSSSMKSARSCLYELCAVNYWKPPFFECCDERGPSHLKEFTFKVVVDIEDASGTVVAIGRPHSKKKEAAENAAVAAMWYLKCAGYSQ